MKIKNMRKIRPILFRNNAKYFLECLKNIIRIRIKKTGAIDDLDPDSPHDINEDNEAIYGII